MATARTSEPMQDFVDGADLVMSCGCGRAMAPADMRRIPPGPGNAVMVRIGCPGCLEDRVDAGPVPVAPVQVTRR